MKTPDEIKKGLECCKGMSCGTIKVYCPYEGMRSCSDFVLADALDYIQQLEKKVEAFEQSAINCCYESRCNKQIHELEALCGRLMDEKEQLERERDAAVGELVGCCFVCRWEETEKCASCHFNADAWNVHESNWEWRGVKE